ncbi:MAG: spore coat protein CotJB, partial [Clostridia bacterium]|nr:spore coat protein CotJB [Clostridia bacterium]
MSEREKLLREISAAQFAAWELNLYLDTHFPDARAGALKNGYEKKYNALVAQYEEKYGPLTAFGDGDERWTAGPWPWEG